MRPAFALSLLLAFALFVASVRSAPAGDVILQYFEGRWQTIERRVPDVFLANYQALWVPPPGKADSGGFSVGYDVFDRFNLGTPFDRTLYGTTEDFRQLSRELDQAGIALYIDCVLNHNGFSDLGRPGFVENGDYPGFVVSLPNDVDGDFHGIFEGGDLNGRLAGLIDIAQEKNHQFFRHPVEMGNPSNIPFETPNPANRRFYPDQDLPMENGRHPFNLEDPMAGDPTIENATGLTLRYLQWMVEVNGVDGFRLDATKHIPTWYFNNFYDARLFNVGRNKVNGGPFTPFSFGENYTGDFGTLAAYVRKDGFGNRDTLDFPLFFAMRSVFGAGGFASMRSLEFASFDGYDGNANDGSLGVLFAGSHDEHGAGSFNGFSNIPHAHILTRAGYPAVYYNAKEFGDGRDFPKDGRGDALGNFGGVVLPRLARINKAYADGPQFTRWIDDDVYIYERANSMIVGLNDRGDSGFDTRSIDTAFRNVTLVELTGNATSMSVDPNNDIFDSIAIGADGRATIRVPRSSSSNGFHGRGYVVYGLEAPRSTLSIANAVGTIGPDPDDGRPEGTRRLATLDIVTADTIDVALSVDGAGPAEDNAIVKLDFGRDTSGDSDVFDGGRFFGWDEFQNGSATSGGGTGMYSTAIDATNLVDGYHYVSTAAFRPRPNGEPAVFDLQRRVVYLDRLPPQAQLLFPAGPFNGVNDIASSSYEVVASAEPLVNSLHFVKDYPMGATDDDIAALIDGSTSARRHDRAEWRLALNDLAPGALRLAMVVFEESGNRNVIRIDGIGVQVPLPQLALGVDNDLSPGGVDFTGVPGEIAEPALAREIVVRVNTANAGDPIAFPADYSVSLIVDDGAPLAAVPYDAQLLPPLGRLVQNDQNLGDDFDEFRFVWRGYAKGQHSFRAVATLTATPGSPNEALAFVNVSESTTGPAIAITRPAPPGETLSNPTAIDVVATLDASAAFAQAFLDNGEDSLPLGQSTNPQGTLSASMSVGSYNVVDVIPPGAISVSAGEFPVRVVATTGANGGGIASQASSVWTIAGVPADPAALFQPTIDGDAAEMFVNTGAIATSRANGGAGGSGPGMPADFGADGSLMELHAVVRDNALFATIRGDLFGATEENFDNVTILLIDANAGSGQGAQALNGVLTDASDGLRGEISAARFALSPMLVGEGHAIDFVFGATRPGTMAGYTLGTDGTLGAFDDFQYSGAISWAYDADAENDAPGASGTTVAAPNAIEIRVPMEVLGNPDAYAIRIAVVTASDDGFPSPNTLPENISDAFDQIQMIETMARIAPTPPILLNEIFVGNVDWIELYNPNIAPVDLGGWTLRMDDGADVRRDFTFPPGAVIDAEGYLLVSDEGGTSPLPDSATTIHAGFNIPWDETRGASAALLDPSGVGKDYVDWTFAYDMGGGGAQSVARNVPYGTAFDGMVIGAASGANGTSLARDAQSTDTDTGGDWDNASGLNALFPTPGAANESTPIDGLYWVAR
jgi:alpha-amylase